MPHWYPGRRDPHHVAKTTAMQGEFRRSTANSNHPRHRTGYSSATMGNTEQILATDGVSA
jgi:hypothetical protein